MSVLSLRQHLQRYQQHLRPSRHRRRRHRLLLHLRRVRIRHLHLLRPEEKIHVWSEASSLVKGTVSPAKRCDLVTRKAI